MKQKQDTTLWITWACVAFIALLILIMLTSCVTPKGMTRPFKRVFVVTFIKDDIMILNYRYKALKCDTCVLGTKIEALIIR